MSDDEPLLKPVDVARRCQLSTKTVLRAIRSGRLRASRLGERAGYRIKPADVDAWIEQSVVEPPVRQAEPAPPPRRSLPPGVGRLVVAPHMGRPSS